MVVDIKLNQLTVEELKRELQKRKLPHVGPKVILVKRLKKALAEAGEDPEKLNSKLAASPASKKKKAEEEKAKKKEAVDTNSENKDSEENEPVKEKKAVERKKKTSDAGKEKSDADEKSISEESKKNQEDKDEGKVTSKDDDDDEEMEAEQPDYEKEEDSDYVTYTAADDLDDILNQDTDQPDYEVDEKDPEVEKERKTRNKRTPKKTPAKKGKAKSKQTQDNSVEENLEHFGEIGDQDSVVIDLNDTELDFSETSGVDAECKLDKEAVEDSGKDDMELKEEEEELKTSKKTSTESVSRKGTKVEDSGDGGSEDAEKKNEPTTLWVSGLASATKAADLKEAFSKHAKVTSAKIVTNAKLPGSRCFGLVTVSSIEDARICIQELNVTELCGRFITVKVFTAKKEKKARESSESSQKEGIKRKRIEPPSQEDEEKERIRAKIRREEIERRRAEREQRRLADELKEERKRQYLREREMREAERRAKEEKDRQKLIEMKQRDEALRLEREREKIKLEREKIERERAELLRLERERLEREREELKKQQLKLEEARRMKRNMATQDEYETRKRPASDSREFETHRQNYNTPNPPPPPMMYHHSDKDMESRPRREEEKIYAKEEKKEEEPVMDKRTREKLYLNYRKMKTYELARLEKMKKELKRELRMSGEDGDYSKRESEGKKERYEEVVRTDRREFSPARSKQRYTEGGGSSFRRDDSHRSKADSSRERFDYNSKGDRYQNSSGDWNSSSKGGFNVRNESNWSGDSRKMEIPPWARPPQPHSDRWPSNSGMRGRGSGSRGFRGSRGNMRYSGPTAPRPPAINSMPPPNMSYMPSDMNPYDHKY